jgi:predicted Zn-dependent peptidase
MEIGAPEYKKTVLSNGVTVITEHHSAARSVCCGIFVDFGTRDEPKHMNGAAHFIEHMVFKGTKRRSAFQIAKSLEEVGGELNAYTTREYTCYYTLSLNEHCRLSLDVLLDLVSQAAFAPRDYGKERDVVISEIDMAKEMFEDSIFDYYFESAYPDHTMGWPILGTEKTLKSFSRRDLVQLYKKVHCGANLIVSIAGNVDHDKAVKLVEERLGKLPRGRKLKRKRPRIKGFHQYVKRPSEQIHLLVGLPGPSFTEKGRLECLVVSALLGGGMTSRLYQKVRERRGLAYTIYSYMSSFTDSGLLMTYAGVAPENVRKTLGVIADEFSRLRSAGIKRRELDMFKTQVTGNILLGSDDLENRMSSIAVNEMIFKKYRSVQRVMDEIQAITRTSVEEYIHRYVHWNQSGLMLVGPIEKGQGKEWLKDFKFK